MKNDQLSSSNNLSVVCCLRKTKVLLSSHLLTLSLAIALTLLVTPFLSAQQRWTRTYGGTNLDWGNSVQQTSDGGYIIAGRTDDNNGNGDVWLIKTNALGNTLWTKTYGDTLITDWGYSVKQTQDGGYIVGGSHDYYGNNPQVYLIKTNASGDSLWTRTYGGAGIDWGYSVQQTADGGYIVTGETWSFGDSAQVYLIKTNASGDTLWSRTYGGTGYDAGYSVQQTQDGGYIIAGETSSYGAGDVDFWLIKTNALGDTLWTRTYGGTSIDMAYSVQQLSDRGYIIVGRTGSFGAGIHNAYLIKTNASGDTLWTKTYGGRNIDYGTFVQQTTDGGYFIAGSTSSYGVHWFDVYLIKTNASGDTLWTRTYGGMGDDCGESAQQTSDGGYIIAGLTASYGDTINGDVYLIKTDANGNVGTERGQGVEGSRVHGFKVNPNPFISFASVPGHTSERFSLYDIAGRKVGTYRGDRIGEGLGPGVYFVCEGTACRAPTPTLLRIVKVR